MRSLFPGMDPYIEACGLWEDFHASLILSLRDSIASLLPANYFAGVGERFYIVGSFPEEEIRHPRQTDLSVDVPRGQWQPARAHEAAAVAVQTEDGSVLIDAFVEEEFHEHFIEIREAKSNKIVTLIEVLSPANKRFDSEGWKLYTRKRYACIEDWLCSFIEIDLLRGGERMPMTKEWPPGPYYLLVKRQYEGRACHVWPGFSLKPLPELIVPLSRPDPDIRIDLQKTIDQIYVRARYHLRIDYRRKITPPLQPDETQWLEERLKERAVAATV